MSVKDDIGGSSATGSAAGGASGEVTQPGSKPGSAGATAREAAQKVLGVAARGEWAPVDQLLKSLEKAAQNVGEDGALLPLANVMDPVSGTERTLGDSPIFGPPFTKFSFSGDGHDAADVRRQGQSHGVAGSDDRAGSGRGCP